MLGLSCLSQGHLHCRYPRKCCLAYSFIPFLFSFLFWRLLQVAEEEGRAGWAQTPFWWQWGRGAGSG